MGKNQKTSSHRTKNLIPWNKNHIPPPRKPHRFSHQIYRSLTGKHERHSEHITLGYWFWISLLLWMWFLNVWDNVPMDLQYVCQQYFTCICFLGFICYKKTFIACGCKKYENLFTHKYHFLLGCCPRGIWYSWVNKFSYFPYQHAINV